MDKDITPQQETNVTVSSANKKNGLYTDFMSKMKQVPYWFYEGFLYEIKKHLQIDNDGEYCTSLKTPFTALTFDLTFAGKKELQTRISRYSLDTYKFLHQISNGYSLLEISVNNFWSLEKSAKFLSFAFQKEFIARTLAPSVPVIAAYLAGELKLGEYLKRLGITDMEQIQEALELQKKSEIEGARQLIGEVFTCMGIITFDDIRSILALKEDADKMALLNFDVATDPLKQELEKAKKTIAKLTSENKALRNKE